MKKLIAICLSIVIVSCAVQAETPYEAMIDGADYLIDLQFANGGWGWMDNYTAPSSNTSGATGQGMLRAYDLTGNAAYLNSAKAAGNYQITVTYPSTTNSRFGTFDPYFMLQLSQRAGDNTWSNHAATNFYDALANGTYGAAGNLNTAGYISAVQANRATTGAYVNLRPWEFSTLAYAAEQIGQSGQDGLFQTAILDGLNTLDSTKGYDFLGVAGAVRGLALMGTTTFDAIVSPNHSGINGIDTLTELADYLVSQQDSAGHWWYGSAAKTPNYDEDTQTSAYAILALMAMNDEAYTASIEAGRSFLVGMQLESGVFSSYPGDTAPFCVEVAGEAVAALPEPATMCLLGLGGLLLRRKK